MVVSMTLEDILMLKHHFIPTCRVDDVNCYLDLIKLYFIPPCRVNDENCSLDLDKQYFSVCVHTSICLFVCNLLTIQSGT